MNRADELKRVAPVDDEAWALLGRVFENAKVAVAKAKREYKELQPDAPEGECWAELEALDSSVDAYWDYVYQRARFLAEIAPGWYAKR